MPDSAFVVIDYGAMRLLRLRVLLLSFLKRWGIGLTLVVVLFAAGSNAPWTIAVGLASTLVVPLASAARHGWWIVPTTAAYAVAGVVPVVVSRSLWWPAAWASAERALPLAPAALRRSDRLVAAIIALPLQAVLAIGVVGIVTSEGGRDVAGFVAVGWVVSALISLQGSVAWMTAVRARHAGRAVGRHRERIAAIVRASGTIRPSIRSLDARIAAIVLPLVRGRARRSAFVMLGGIVATGASATASIWSGVPIAWSLAIHAFCALALTSVGSDATRRELQPLWLAHAELPLPRAACERWRNGVVLLPTLVGVVASGVTAVATVPLVRLVPLAAYVTGVVGGGVVEALVERTSATDVRAARWLLTLVICIACASEVA